MTKRTKRATLAVAVIVVITIAVAFTVRYVRQDPFTPLDRAIAAFPVPPQALAVERRHFGHRCILNPACDEPRASLIYEVPASMTPMKLSVWLRDGVR